MRAFTMTLPLLAFLAALSQGFFPQGGNFDGGADPRTTAIFAKRLHAKKTLLARQAERQSVEFSCKTLVAVRP